MKPFTILLFAIFALVGSTRAQTAKMSSSDLRPLEGIAWTGELSYLEYGSKKSVSIKSNVVVNRDSADKLKWKFAFSYPHEPNANREEIVVLTCDGKAFDGENVTERKKLKDGTLLIVTSSPGKDDDRDAIFRHTYTIGRNTFSIRKDVRFVGESEFFERNTYRWSR
jgi:hypothetical protein